MERGGSSYALQLAFPQQEDVKPVTGPVTVRNDDKPHVFALPGRGDTPREPRLELITVATALY